MRRIILARASESGPISNELRTLFANHLFGNVEMLEPEANLRSSVSDSAWIMKEARNIDFLVIFYTKPDPVLPASSPVIATGAAAVTADNLAALPRSTKIITLISKDDDIAHLPPHLSTDYCYNVSSWISKEAVLCKLVHNPVTSSTGGAGVDFGIGAFSLVTSMTMTAIGDFQKTNDFLLGRIGEEAATWIYKCMVFIVVLLNFVALIFLLRSLKRMIEHHFRKNLFSLDLDPKMLTKRRITVGVCIFFVAASLTAVFSKYALPNSPSLEEARNKQLTAWAQLLSNSQHSNGGIRTISGDGVPQVWTTAQSLSGLLASGSFLSMTPADIDRAFIFTEQSKITPLALTEAKRASLESDLAQEFPTGDFSKLPIHFPTFLLAENLIARMAQQESLKPETLTMLDLSKRTYFTVDNSSQEGWGYFEQWEWGVTEIAAWVAMADIADLRARPHPSMATIQSGTVADELRECITILLKRQTSDGGFSPITDVSDTNYSRTYSTVMAIWAIGEYMSPDLQAYNQSDPSKLEDVVERGVKWLTKNAQTDGWNANPNNPTNEKPFLGLTAQALFVINRIPVGLDQDATVKAIYALKHEFLGKIARLATRSLGEDGNDREHDGDRYLYPTDRSIEGSTFLWYPWTIALLRSLSGDKTLTESDRKTAAAWYNRLSGRVGEFGSFVSCEYNYAAAEGLVGFKWPAEVQNR